MQNHGEISIDTPPSKDAWPSSYYGRTRRIDLEKFYHDLLKNSNHDESSSDDEEDEQVNHISVVGVTSTITKTKSTKKVSFSTEPPTVYEYEAEYDEPTRKGDSLFDDGWPGRTKKAMKSSGFIDFKSKIEAKLGAINDPSLISQLDTICNEPITTTYGGYRQRKSPLVQKLNLRPIPNSEKLVQPSLLMDDTPSPSSSYTDSPLTPRDSYSLLEPSVSSASTSSSSILSPGGSKWLNRTLSRIRNNSPSRSK
ncbi:uncharacterized protein EV154DRAFT_477612 [Mucor mucedo]|uniref:uncharacterized protein n=1 Tax=Mucor mucedo TaxID=29922 RepID=UPI0022200081|nr:uncharacterized protein EV154DRAFT_477612 [Mucor mucedo]KAI7895163.1 hypothetical protein EV154DRAFT_477612 [Mucor mucedo]